MQSSLEKRAVKAAVRERDGNRCVDCGAKPLPNRRLSVHRITPGSLYYLDGCVTLCPSCHRFRHAKASHGLPMRQSSIHVCDELYGLVARESDELDIPMIDVVVRALAEHFQKPELGFVPRKPVGRKRVKQPA